MMASPFLSRKRPGAGGDWDRELLPNGDPLSLLILADKSASMDESQRRTQAEFLATLLSSLSPRDAFNLAACDVNCDWAFESIRSVDGESAAKAREFLSKRRSLGWTDLGKAVESAIGKQRSEVSSQKNKRRMSSILVTALSRRA